MAAFVPMARPIWTEEMREEAIETLDSGIWVKGPKNRLFSDNFAQYCKASAAIPCSSGSTALYVALRLLRIGPGDEVILPSPLSQRPHPYLLRVQNQFLQMLKLSIGVSALMTHVFVLMRKLKQSLESIFLVKPTIQN